MFSNKMMFSKFFIFAIAAALVTGCGQHPGDVNLEDDGADETASDLSITSGNLVQDSGFERGTSGFTIPMVYFSESSPSYVKQSTENPIRGNASLKIKLGDASTVSWYSQVDAGVSLTQIRVSASIRADDRKSGNYIKMCADAVYIASSLTAAESSAIPSTAKCVNAAPYYLGTTSTYSLTKTLDGTRPGGYVMVWFARVTNSGVTPVTVKYSVDSVGVISTTQTPPPPASLSLAVNSTSSTVTVKWTLSNGPSSPKFVVYRAIAQSSNPSWEKITETTKNSYTEANGFISFYYRVDLVDSSGKVLASANNAITEY